MVVAPSAEPESSNDVSQAGMVRFSSATTSYRIFRLSIELFLVEHVLQAGYSATNAGQIYLAYSISDIIAGLFFLWYPTLWFGSTVRGVAFVFFAVSLISGGFVGLFFVSGSFRLMATFGAICGVGTATWFVNYQTLTNTSFAAARRLGQIARVRQVFECVGFLLPSICLGVVNSTNGAGTDKIIRRSAVALAVVGVLFFVGSADMVISEGFKIKEDALVKTPSVWAAIKTFVESSVIKNFCLNSILLAAANVFFPTLSIVTERYFGLKSTFLWLAAIGFPIGGAISVAFVLYRGVSKKFEQQRVLSGACFMAFTFVIMIVVSPWAASTFRGQNHLGSKLALFAFGLVFGFLYSGTYTAAFSLWLNGLKDETPNFVARANVFHNVGVQALIACTFQLQTLLIDTVINKEVSIIKESLVLFGPLVILFGAAAALVAFDLPCSPDPKFGWPIRLPRSWIMWLKIAEFLQLGTLEDMFFGLYCDYRSSLFARRLNRSQTRGGPKVGPESKLCVADLRRHLESFDQLETCEQWWCSSVNLVNILMGNQGAFLKRLDLISRAVSSIWVLSWELNGDAGHILASLLVERHDAGVEVKVIVDAVNLYGIEAMRNMLGTGENESLHTFRLLVDAGVDAHMLDTWHGKESSKPYVIGTHRKILLVDNEIMLTGGRNVCDDYTTPEDEQAHFVDIDVVMIGDFSETTGPFLENLWEASRDLKVILKDIPLSNERSAGVTKYPDANSFAVNDIEQLLQEESAQSAFFRKISLLSLDELDHKVSCFQLDHKAGRVDGLDIIYSSLLFIVETAEATIDLAFGYFQMFDELEKALVRALSRGVKIRVITNSRETNDVYFFNEIFRKAIQRLMEMGIEIYVPSSKNSCVHYKYVIADSRVLFVGSWNCLGTSVFYDAEFSTVIMQDETSISTDALTTVKVFLEEAISSGIFVRLTKCPDPYAIPFVATLASTKYGRKQIGRGF